MAQGDTIPGEIRILREDTEGNRNVVFGPRSQSEVDDNADLSPEEQIYLNTGISDRVTAPNGAKKYTVPDADFQAGEKLIIQHKASSLSEASDSDFDGWFIDTLTRDMNRGRIYPQTLTAGDNEITGDPSTSTSDYVDVFEETVPDRQEYRLAGSLIATVVENA